MSLLLVAFSNRTLVVFNRILNDDNTPHIHLYIIVFIFLLFGNRCFTNLTVRYLILERFQISLIQVELHLNINGNKIK